MIQKQTKFGSKFIFPIGKDDYKKIIDEKCVYIDKTLLIKEFWEDGSEVILITRPRRFGKTIALSMLRYFFEKTEKSNAYLFENSHIWKEQGFQELQGTFPVIFLSFKDIKSDTWSGAYAELQSLIKSEVDRTLTPIKSLLNEQEKIDYKALMDLTLEEDKLRVAVTDSLKFLTKTFQRIYKKNTIVLIDEYDTPITYAYMNGFYEKMIQFMRSFLSKGLKGNPCLHRGIMTGVVRTAKDGIVSGLNHPLICTMLNPEFSTQFGFTEEEVDHLLQITETTDKKQEIKAWYNGYMIGIKNPQLMQPIYNPWSVLNYVKSATKNPECYWSNTGSKDLLERLIAESGKTIQEELQLLMEGKPLENKSIDEDVILLDLDNREREPWSFLFFAGYITASNFVFKDKYFYSLQLPNKEIATLYKELVIGAINKKFSSAKLENLHKTLLQGDVEQFSDSLNSFVQSLCSSHDLPEPDLERSLHLFVLGLLASLSNDYLIESNLESGKGRCDIMLCPFAPSTRYGVLIEFKKGKKENLEDLAKEALHQIKEKDYRSRFYKLKYEGPILAYGIASHKKELLVKMETILK